ncbi:MAG: hypothetical protein J6A08_06575 [Lachnospiraceae bacterium]|nr:hypothetical protein [Lachnospiraceae bacterium]
MQERSKESDMNIRGYINQLGKNPKNTEDVLKLVESDLEYGLTIEETKQYTSKKYDYAQMKVYSACLRNGYPQEVRECLTDEGMTGEQMAVALEFYEKGVSLEIIRKVMAESGNTAFEMKKLFQNVVAKVQETGAVVQEREGYAKELMEQIKSVVQKIEFQEKRYDALNEQLQKIQTAERDVEVENNLLKQMKEKDSTIEVQQNELNEARAAVIRLRNEKDQMNSEMEQLRKEKDRLEKRTGELEKEAAEKEKQSTQQSVAERTEPQKMEEKEETQPETKAGAKPDTVSPGRTEMPVFPLMQGMGCNVAVVDAAGRIVSVVPVERMERKKENHSLSALFSRLAFKKKINIVKLVAEKDLAPGQLVQIRNAIEKGLTEEQLLVLINHKLPAEQMEEIINIAVYENRQKQGV